MNRETPMGAEEVNVEKVMKKRDKIVDKVTSKEGIDQDELVQGSREVADEMELIQIAEDETKKKVRKDFHLEN